MFLKIMILLVVLAGVGLFILKGPNGEPFLTLDDFTPDPEITDVLAQKAEPVTIYKWQDEDGAWHFSNEPVDVEGVETMVVDGDINLIPAVTTSTSRAVKRPDAKAYSSIPAGVTSVAPEQITELMGTVNNMQEMVDERKTNLDRTAREN
jgi:hypothetical protein